MQKTKYFGNCQGFTLLEVLLSVLILGIIVASLAPILVFSSHSSEYNRAKALATNLANKKMEEIRALPFNEIGTAGGNPAGSIPQEETVKIGRYTFKVETFINWIEEGGCLSGNNADWDYKQVRIRVTCPGFFYQGKQSVNVELSSLFSRDAEQPALTGANLRVCVFRAWGAGLNPNTGQFDVNFIKPVSGVKVTAKNGSTAQVYTTGKGSALFLGMTAGNYEVNVDPTMRGMIIFPGSFPQKDIEITNNNTRQLFAWVEEPCRLRIFLQDIAGHPVVFTPGSGTGNIRLCYPYPEKPAEPEKNYLFTSSLSTGEVLNHPFQSLWPVGEGFAGRYRFKWEDDPYNPDNDPGISGYVPAGKNGEYGAWDEMRGRSWEGDFTAPGTEKRLVIFLIPIPEIAAPLSAASLSWLQGNSINSFPLSLTNKGIAFVEVVIDPQAEPPLTMYVLKPCIFRGSSANIPIELSSGTPGYTASAFVFDHKEIVINPGAQLKLKGNTTVFYGTLKLEKQATDSGKIVFNIIESNIPYNGKPVSIRDENGQLVIEEALDGMEIRDYLGNPGKAGVKYGEAYFYKDVRDDSGNIILNKGAYYLPDGFTLPDDAAKRPSEGGPLRR